MKKIDSIRKYEIIKTLNWVAIIISGLFMICLMFGLAYKLAPAKVTYKTLEVIEKDDKFRSHFTSGLVGYMIVADSNGKVSKHYEEDIRLFRSLKDGDTFQVKYENEGKAHGLIIASIIVFGVAVCRFFNKYIKD